jgi:hypothetical protein
MYRFGIAWMKHFLAEEKKEQEITLLGNNLLDSLRCET